MSNAVYKIVTDRIIAELEKGTVPWQKPWAGVRTGAYSRSTGKPYSLLNQMLLGRPGEYLTYKQSVDAGHPVRKGAKGSMVVFWKMLPSREDDDKVIPVLRYYTVYHIDQCDDLAPKYKMEDLPPMDPIADAELLSGAYLKREGIKVHHQIGDEAYYSPTFDRIVMPEQTQFTAAPEYYSTLFHELVHSTGHAKRLDRISKKARFGNEEYSKEELVAEIGSAAILCQLGIETPSSFKNSAAYIQSWIAALQDDPRLIVSAASQSEKAVEFIRKQ